MTVQPLTERTAGVAGAAFLAGTPVVLARVGWPLEADGVGWAEVVMHLRALTLPSSLLLAALVCLVAAAWTVYAAATVADLLRVLRGQAPRMAVARIAAAALAATASGTALAVPAAADTAPAYSAAPTSSAAEHGPDEREHQQDPGQGVHRHRTVAGFALESADLDADMRARLDSVAELVRSYGDPDTAVTVTGHADPTGGDAYNRLLSQRRAEAAATYLRSRVGEQVDVVAEGVGSVQPRSDGAQAYADLRRVEIDYRLQPPPAPQDTDGTAADHDEETPAAPAHEDADSGLAGGAAAAASTAALAGGYALGRWGRRRGRTGDSGHCADTAGESGDDAQSDDRPADGADEEPAADASTPSTGPGRIHLGPDLTVDAACLAITGPGGPGIAAALLARAAQRAPGSAIATRPALAQIGWPEETDLPGITRVNGIEAALVRAEAHLVAAQRTADDEDTGVPAAPLVLVENLGTGATGERVQALLAADTPTRPTVVIPAEVGQGARVHADTERLRITDADGTVRELAIDAAWTHAVPTADREEGHGSTTAVPEPAAGPTEGETDQPEHGDESCRVALRLFAPRLGVEVGEDDVADRLRASARLLLAFLAIHPRGATGDEIGELLAPNASPARARSARNNALSSARTTLRTALGTEETPVIEADSGRYRLQAELFDVDLWHFNDALARTKTASGETRTQNRRAVVAQYPHELLSDVTESWVETERHRCRRSAAETCVRLAEESVDGDEKISWLDRACAIDRYNEMVHRTLIEAQAEIDDSDAVHRTYQRLSENLREIDDRPSKELRGRVEMLTSVAPMRAGTGR